MLHQIVTISCPFSFRPTAKLWNNREGTGTFVKCPGGTINSARLNYSLAARNRWWKVNYPNTAMLQKLEDFNQFCKTFDIRTVIAAADQRSLVPGYEKELYAIAILRAVQHGDFGSDPDRTAEAVSALWERGNRCGFNVDSYNAEFENYFRYW